MSHIKSFSTISIQFWTRQTVWRDRREKTTAVLNKILDELEKKEKCTQQQSCLRICRDSGIVLKGLQVTVPKGIMGWEQVKKWKIKCKIELMQKTIKWLFVKQQNADNRIATLKLQLQNKFKMGENGLKTWWNGLRGKQK